MSRYAGVKNNNIYVVSDIEFVNDELNIVEIPAHLNNISSNELISDYRFRENIFKHRDMISPAKKLKVALVSNWKMRCGIATYAEFLYSELIKHVGDYKFFVEKNDIPTGDMNYACETKIPDNKIIACWSRGESLKELIEKIKEYNPDVVLINHEFGIWPNARYWLSLMNQLSEFRVIVTMHSVFHHRDKTICEAAMPEIIVHLPGALDVLKNEKGIFGKVHVVPHGCGNYNGERLWNFYRSDRTFMQQGFLYRYKSWQSSIEAVAILKEKYNDVFFTGLCSESPFSKNEHQIYYNELMELIDRLDVKENVALIRGFQSEQVIDSFLRINKAAVFPYASSPEHEVFGASGAARTAMSKGIPVITSNVNHFSDLNTIKADTPHQIAHELDKLFSNQLLVKQQIELQQKYVEENGWANIAMKYVDVIEQ